MENKLIITPKEKAKDLRTWIAYKLVDLANFIRPGNKAAVTYLMGIMQESMLEELLYGKSELEIKVKKHEEEGGENNGRTNTGK